MSNAAHDHYDVYYADKLWTLLPAVYRAEDTTEFGAKGPLRELADRIGGTAAELRRGMDRLWEDQSIETCDDWVIPYIAELVDTRLILGLDARGQRLDVANTIDYRRRKGTLSVLEQIASDISGWDAKAIEFFRRLARTRHGLDPAIGPAATATSDLGQLQRAEGLIGPVTRTPIGGFADLRNVDGARQSRTAFDEFFHTADTRAGQGLYGWQNIPHLGVFVWRLLSLAVGPVTPVAVQNCPNWWCFDPTGRDIPLFAAPRTAAAFGDSWVPPVEGQLPGPISQALLNADLTNGAAGLRLYPNALCVFEQLGISPPDIEPIEPTLPLKASALQLRPERGRLFYSTSPPAEALVTTYHYGFPSLIGAGPYDRRGQAFAPSTPPPALAFTGGGAELTAVLPRAGTIMVTDSLTYDGVSDLTVTGALTIASGNNQRPLIRLGAAKPWIITGGSANAVLNLDGLFISGQDIVLTGQFASVTITCSTLDPGNAATASVSDAPTSSPLLPLFQVSADGRDLRPTHLWITGEINTLTIDRCVLGPVRTVTPGAVETMTISNSTLQAIRTSDLGAIVADEVKDSIRLLRVLQLGLDPVSQRLRTLDPSIATLLGPPANPPLSAPPPPPGAEGALLTKLNTLIAGLSLYDAATFAGVSLSAATQRNLAAARSGQAAPALNRLLLEDAFPLELADTALAFGDGTLILSRCTVLGRAQAHRLSASECILHELCVTDDLQDGCTRFSAWATGSRIPRPYECVQIRQLAPLFTSTDFGQPAYAQLRAMADAQIISPTTPSTTPLNTISAGAADGSEMGAFARDKNPIRAQALLLKLQEFMPANLTPVIVDVT
ncbi:hypothetical protein [Bradyrhizobium sp. McL0616]|uniref:hypothetical protein n=1 Tax=Bradyrhizobium sp. McL0616 TaxID=3415674 RepID=UPI003CE95763